MNNYNPVTRTELQEDLKNLEIRLDEKFVTKEDIKNLEIRLDEKFVTKEDIKNLEVRLDEKFASKIDLADVKVELIGSIQTMFKEQTEELKVIIEHEVGR